MPQRPAPSPDSSTHASTHGARGRTSRAFIDVIDGPNARVLVDEVLYTLPMALLPQGAQEGAWIEIRVEPIAAPPSAAATEAKRKALSAGDDGGDFSL
jgi:hypothetical protein